MRSSFFRSPSFVVCLLAMIAGGFAAPSAYGQTGGAIDTSFGASGVAQNTTVTGDVSQVVGLADGKVLAAGNCMTGFGSGSCLYRWTSAGAPDTTFGIGGVAYVLQNATDPRFVLRPDGRIAVAATCGSAICIAQANANGTAFDPSFAGGSFSTLLVPNVNAFTSVSLGDLLLLPDGRLLVGGTCATNGGSTGFCITRLIDGPIIDSTFGVSPHNWSTTLPGAGDKLAKLTLLPDGRFLASGTCGATQATRTLCIGRFFNNGGFQNTYTVDAANRWEQVLDARVVGSQITVAGGLFDFTGPSWNSYFPFAARREIYAVPGSVDTSYGGAYPTSGIGGGFNIDSSNDGAMGAAVIAHDGGVVFFGRCNSGTVLCSMRLGPNGTLDTAFGVGGRYEYAGYSYPNAGSGSQSAMGKGPGEQLYLGGSCAGTRPCVYRFTDITPAAPRCSMDIDGDGRVNATTDGLMLLRAMLGFGGTNVIGGAVGANASRPTWPQVREYLIDQCRMELPTL